MKQIITNSYDVIVLAKTVLGLDDLKVSTRGDYKGGFFFLEVTNEQYAAIKEDELFSYLYVEDFDYLASDIITMT